MLTPLTNISQLLMLFREHLTYFFYQKLKLTKILLINSLNNFRIFRKDRSRYGRGIMFYVNENLPCKVLTAGIDNLTETIFLEVNIHSSK